MQDKRGGRKNWPHEDLKLLNFREKFLFVIWRCCSKRSRITQTVEQRLKVTVFLWVTKKKKKEKHASSSFVIHTEGNYYGNPAFLQGQVTTGYTNITLIQRGFQPKLLFRYVHAHIIFGICILWQYILCIKYLQDSLGFPSWEILIKYSSLNVPIK